MDQKSVLGLDRGGEYGCPHFQGKVDTRTRPPVQPFKKGRSISGGGADMRKWAL